MAFENRPLLFRIDRCRRRVAAADVVNVCSVMSKRHDGAGIIYAGRGKGRDTGKEVA